MSESLLGWVHSGSWIKAKGQWWWQWHSTHCHHQSLVSQAPILMLSFFHPLLPPTIHYNTNPTPLPLLFTTDQALAPPSEALTLFQLQSVGAIGDYLDLIVALTNEGPDYDSMTDSELLAFMRKNNHCSALVKVTGDLSELFFSHVAWFLFQSMTRIFKHYNFNLNQVAVAGRQMSFSSYPAYLSSLDDWYAVWDSGIAVLETTNNVFNKTLYQAVVPESLFAWHRVRLANLLAHDLPQWASVFSQYNSGTYNNQYPIVMVSSFVPGQALKASLSLRLCTPQPFLFLTLLSLPHLNFSPTRCGLLNRFLALLLLGMLLRFWLWDTSPHITCHFGRRSMTSVATRTSWRSVLSTTMEPLGS